MKKSLPLFVVLYFFALVQSKNLMCYFCAPSSSNDCVDVEDGILMDCKDFAPFVTYSCISMNVSGTNTTDAEGIFRSCLETPEGVTEPCEYIKKQVEEIGNVTWCEVCSENKCNTGVPWGTLALT